MSNQNILKPRKKKVRRTRIGAVFTHAAAAGGGAAALGEMPISFREPDEGKNKAATALISALLHGGVVGLLLLAAAMNPEVVDDIINVTLVQDKPRVPARKVIQQRRKVDFSPAVQAQQPQVINNRVIAEAAPKIEANVVQMDAVNTNAAPTQVSRSSIDVARVSAVGSIGGYRASKVEVNRSDGPVVRGPVRTTGPVGPSVGPRKVVGTSGSSLGTGNIGINQGSSVQEGRLSSRDVIGSPTGAELQSVNTRVGEGNLHGTGGSASGLLGGAAPDCLERAEVKAYLGQIKQRVNSRWTLPYGVENVAVKLRFQLDVAGSASSVQLVEGDNALGASAIDAMRNSSPFPHMPARARCLAQKNIVATFTSSVAG